MKPISTIFFGTHTFAATILQGLLNSPFIDVQLIITQPDKPVGRKQELQASPVALLAQKNNLRIEKPTSLKEYPIPGHYQLGVVAQYGNIIPKQLLTSADYGLLNIHTSLLPKYRGASPIQTALMNGEKETGVSIMLLDEGMDTGPILLQKKIMIDPDDTYEILDKKLAELSITALLETILPYVEGRLLPQPQNHSEATVTNLLERDAGRIDWHKSADEIYNLYRGLTPWPGIWTTWDKKRLKLLKIKPSDKKSEPGLISLDNDSLTAGCATGSLDIRELQIEGKKPMDAKTFLNGYKTFAHAYLI